MKTYIISYRKHFVTGPLASLSAPVRFEVPEDVAILRQAIIRSWTKNNPGSDALTGTLYYVTEVSCSEKVAVEVER